MKMQHIHTKFFNTWLHIVLVFSLLFIPFVAAITFVAEPVFAAPGINKQIPFQGTLTTNAGVNAADGNYDIVFQMYNVATGGSALWTESRTGGNQVAVASGKFSVLLGSITALTLDFNTDTFYLGITVASDSEMTPRKRLGAAPYAFNADTVDGIHIIITTATPEGSQAGSVGDIALDTTSGALYIKTSGTGNTGWTQVGVGNSLGQAYNQGGAITTTDAKDIDFVLAVPKVVVPISVVSMLRVTMSVALATVSMPLVPPAMVSVSPELKA